MALNPTNELFISLTEILNGNRSTSETILKALELICNGTAQNCGLIYEATSPGNYNLLAQYGKCPATLKSHVGGDELSRQDCDALAKRGISKIAKGQDNSKLELFLMKLCETEAMVFAPLLDDDKKLYGFIILIGEASLSDFCEMDITVLSAVLFMLVQHVRIEMLSRKVTQAKTTMENILDNMGIDIYVNDFYTHEILYANKSMAAPYGGLEKFMGHKCWQSLFSGQTGPCEFCPQSKIIDENGLPTNVYTWDYQRQFDGSWFRVFSAAFWWIDGRLAHVVSSADITDNKRNEALIENLANYDQLTKLPNRRMLEKECEKRISSATSTEQGYVLFFDIDGFKTINDSLGHDAGDEFLVQLGQFFSGIPMIKDSIYRNGGDEFVAVVGGEDVTKDNIRTLTAFIHERFHKPWVLKKGEVFCNISIGVACYPEDGIVTEVLLQKADMAMYQVKRAGGGGLCFGYQLNDAGVQVISIEKAKQ